MMEVERCLSQQCKWSYSCAPGKINQ